MLSLIHYSQRVATLFTMQGKGGRVEKRLVLFCSMASSSNWGPWLLYSSLQPQTKATDLIVELDFKVLLTDSLVCFAPSINHEKKEKDKFSKWIR